MLRSTQCWDTTSISLTAACDLFMRYVTRTSALEYEDFNSAKSRLLERAEKFGEISFKVNHSVKILYSTAARFSFTDSPESCFRFSNSPRRITSSFASSAQVFFFFSSLYLSLCLLFSMLAICGLNFNLQVYHEFGMFITSVP